MTTSRTVVAATALLALCITASSTARAAKPPREFVLGVRVGIFTQGLGLDVGVTRRNGGSALFIRGVRSSSDTLVHGFLRAGVFEPTRQPQDGKKLRPRLSGLLAKLGALELTEDTSLRLAAGIGLESRQNEPLMGASRAGSAALVGLTVPLILVLPEISREYAATFYFGRAEQPAR
ncbi:MAG: hypothetical protein IT371_31860 [Deltaproteobacteria bacterium]|nr:hypothetical protein [Deltaproteobacteria bacterium]